MLSMRKIHRYLLEWKFYREIGVVKWLVGMICPLWASLDVSKMALKKLENVVLMFQEFYSNYRDVYPLEEQSIKSNRFNSHEEKQLTNWQFLDNRYRTCSTRHGDRWYQWLWMLE